MWFWRGPSPFHFVTVPEPESDLIAQVAASVTYGWGMIPCAAQVGEIEWTTSLWPREDGYVLPVKAAVRAAEEIELGDVVVVTLRIG